MLASPAIPVVILDTNFLLDFPNLSALQWKIRPLEFLVSETVVDELRGLKNHVDPDKARWAQKAAETLDGLRGTLGSLANQLDLTVTFAAPLAEVQPPLQRNKTDHQLIALALKFKQNSPARFCAILTRDRELCDIAEAMSVIVVIPGRDEFRFHQELSRKYEWWSKFRETDAARPLTAAPSKTARTATEPKPAAKEVNCQTQLELFVKHIYDRVRAVDFRAVLSVPLLQARLGLTCHLIQRLSQPDKRVAIIVVESESQARYWAGEIRKQCGLSKIEAPIFGVDEPERLDKARVVIYRQDQVADRLPQHADRLKQAGKRLTAIVDGCDILDAVDLAHLLFTCDQFVGFNWYPLDYSSVPGARMLNSFLHGNALLSYSFVDAERDGWGNPVDLFRHPIIFTPDEREHWDQRNAEYLRLRERAAQEHLELREASDFWMGLDNVLRKTVSPEISNLIPLREEREQIAHLASNKLEVVGNLFTTSAHKTSRRLILDYNRIWTPVMLKRLSQMGVQSEELPLAEDSQRSVWDRFAGNQCNTLLISDVPALDLPGAHIQQLIILTPLRPLAEMSAVIDWALSHTLAKEALRVDVLYVENTPEELAMLELAQSGFGFRYEMKA